MKVVFLGSAEFGLPSLEAMIRAGHEIAGVVSTPAKPKGRGLQLADSPVVDWARAHAISPVLTPADLKSAELSSQLAGLRADVFVVIAFRILPESLFAIPPKGTLNVHASLLPRYRGPAPIQRAIQNGEPETGITVFRIDTGVDTGGIILQKRTAIGPAETTPQLYDRLSAMGAEALVEALGAIAAGTARPLQQDDSKAGKAPKLTKAEGRINWELPAETIFNMIRAFKPFPGTHTFVSGRRLSIEWAMPVKPGTGNAAPGQVCAIDKEGFYVQCGENQLKVTEVKPDGKGAMSAAAFIRGNPLTPGELLG